MLISGRSIYLQVANPGTLLSEATTGANNPLGFRAHSRGTSEEDSLGGHYTTKFMDEKEIRPEFLCGPLTQNVCLVDGE